MFLIERLTLHYAGLGLFFCFGILAWNSLYGAGVSLSLFYICLAMSIIFYLWPQRLVSSQVTLPVVLSWAIVFRMVGFIGEPLFEDDFYRYLWDGYQLMSNGNPYAKAPEVFFTDSTVPSEFQTILGNINYPEIPTVYGPGLQFIFGISYWIKPAELWPLKTILISLDLLLIYMLAGIGKIKNVLLYAWNPLVIKEIAFTAHIDGLVPLLLIAAWLCKQHGRHYWMSCLLGFAITVKISALLMIPFFLWRAGWKPVMWFAATIIVCYLPFIGKGGSDMFALMRFAQDWQFNSAFYGILKWLLPGTVARYILAVTVIIWVGWIWSKHQQQTPTALPRGDLIFAGLILVSPTINPWYWLWVLPFSVIYPSRWVWVASVALLLSYITGLNLESETLQAYQQPLWVPWIEFGVIAAAVFIDCKPEKLKVFYHNMRRQK